MNARTIKDRIAGNISVLFGGMAVILIFIIAIGLCLKSWPILSVVPVKNLFLSQSWQPMKNSFGLVPFIAGTFWVTTTALIIAVPFALLTAIFLSEYAPVNLKQLARPLIDLLAGIPSVIYGVWGVLVIVPLVKNHIAPIFGRYSSGYTVLTAGIVLAVMILPVIIHISIEVMGSVPDELRDASLSLGATKWQTVKHVVVRKSMPGIAAAVVLGFSRAFGETMAVLMVAGNVARMPGSVFDPAYPLPALIANNYGEMMSIPLYDSALLTAALVLFIIVMGFNILSQCILVRINRRAA